MKFEMLTLQGTHFQIGEQFGEACREGIKEMLEWVKTQPAGKAVHDEIEPYFGVYEAFMPEMLQEQQGIARGAGITEDEAFILQLRWSLKHKGECTSFAVLPTATTDHTMYCGINKDVSPFSRDHMRLVHMCPAEGPECVLVGYDGSLAGPGMNGCGVCFFGNSLYGSYNGPALPDPIMQRMILSSANAAEALTRLLQAHEAGYTGGSGHALICDPSGACFGFERLADRYCIAAPKRNEAFYAHANHMECNDTQMRTAENAEKSGNSFARRERLYQLLEQNCGTIDVNLLKTFLQDHSSGTFSICRHNAVDTSGAVTVTAASIIAEPQNGRISIAHGNPCCNPYIDVQL